MNYIGIDPGASGGLARLLHDGRKVDYWTLKDATPNDVLMKIIEWRDDEPPGSYAVIERVASSPQMGVKSAFSFGKNYGMLLTCLSATDIPFVEVTPAKWQRALGCLSKGDKNVTKAKAQQLFPAHRITHAIADALLLATYCRQKHAELF